MSRAGVTIDGLAGYRRALAAMPDEMTARAHDLVQRAARDAYDEIKKAYPLWEGPPTYLEGRLVTPEHLRDGLEIAEAPSWRYRTATLLLQNSMLAYVYENGTAVRRTKSGALRGSGPPGHVFIPRVIRHRRLLERNLKAMLVAEGLVVT